MCVGGRLGCVGCPPWRPIVQPYPHPNPQPVAPPVVVKKPQEIIIPLTGSFRIFWNFSLLLTADQPGVVTTVKVVDFTAEITIKQRYENIEDFPIEAV